MLGNPLGIKVGDRETRDIFDIWSITQPEIDALAYFDPNIAKRDYNTLPEAVVLAAARNREANRTRGVVALHAQSQAARPGCAASTFRR